jgi:hypothetical protein
MKLKRWVCFMMLVLSWKKIRNWLGIKDIQKIIKHLDIGVHADYVRLVQLNEEGIKILPDITNRLKVFVTHMVVIVGMKLILSISVMSYAWLLWQEMHKQKNFCWHKRTKMNWTVMWRMSENANKIGARDVQTNLHQLHYKNVQQVHHC